MVQHVEHSPVPRARVWAPRARVWAAGAVLAALLVAMGALALSPSQSRRQLLQALQTAAAPARVGPSSAAHFSMRSQGGYALGVTLTPNRADGPIGLSLRILRHGRPLTNARVRVGFSMPSMNMWNAYTAALGGSVGGRYAATIPVLGMAGSWRLRIDMTPRSGRPFRVAVNDRLPA